MTLVAVVPVYLTVEVEGVNVPTFTKGVPEPERVIVLDDPSRVPALRLSIEFTFNRSLKV